MKTRFAILLIAFMAFVSLKVLSQNIPTYSIPSYNIPVDSLVNFTEKPIDDPSSPSEGKRILNVEVKSKGLAGNCNATVWIYSLDRTTILGPYEMTCGQILSVDIDDREWGVLVESEDELLVDVWFSY
jgi:hypothetical protein